MYRSILRKLCWKVHCRSRILGGNLDFNPFFLKEKKKKNTKLCVLLRLLSSVVGVLDGLLHLIKTKSTRKLLSIFPFILQDAEALMKLLVSERDVFANHIYPYLVNFVGKGIVYLECFGKKLDFNSIKKKIKYVT